MTTCPSVPLGKNMQLQVTRGQQTNTPLPGANTTTLRRAPPCPVVLQGGGAWAMPPPMQYVRAAIERTRSLHLAALKNHCAQPVAALLTTCCLK
jgi:hypothetical protein